MPYNADMKQLLGPSCLILAFLTCSFAQTQPSPVKRVPSRPTAAVDGKQLFLQYCASCHGADAKGGGPAASALKTAPTDLTSLAAKSNGKFPDDRVLRILQGGEDITAHGTRDMPVWGPIFNNMSPNLMIKQTRVYSLLNYLEGIQAK